MSIETKVAKWLSVSLPSIQYQKKHKISKLRKIARYHLLDRYRYRKAQKQLQSEKVPVLVYTMAKVASSTIYHSIKNQSDLPVFHIHSLDQQKILKAELDCKAKGVLPDSRNPGGLIYQKKIAKQLPVKIITCVREPIARNLSAFFEVFEYYLGTSPTEWKGNQADLMKVYFKELPHEFPLNWFDEEFKRMTNLDVYKGKFDTDKMYRVYQKENLEVLLFRTDLADEKKESLIQNFLALPGFKLTAHNVGAQKNYAKIYAQFKQEIQLPENYLKQMLESKYARYFFSEQEIEKVYYNWQGKRKNEKQP